MADFLTSQRVRLVTPLGDTAMDDTNDAVRVNIVAGSAAGAEFAEDSVAGDGDNGKVALVVRKDTPGSNVDADGDYATLLQDANGRLYVNIHDGGNSITIDNATLSVVGGGTEATALRVTIANDSTGVLSVDDNGGSITVDGTVTVTATDLDIRDLTHVSDSVKVGDGTDFLAISAAGAASVDIVAQSLTAIKISKDANANSELNPIWVQMTDTLVSGEEIHNYDTSAAIASDASDNHDYTVAGTTFFLESIIFSASGEMKIELQVGPVASLVTKAVYFTSVSNLGKQLFFDPPIEVPAASTGTVRIIRTNRDNQAMDVYSTIIGRDV